MDVHFDTSAFTRLAELQAANAATIAELRAADPVRAPTSDSPQGKAYAAACRAVEATAEASITATKAYKASLV